MDVVRDDCDGAVAVEGRPVEAVAQQQAREQPVEVEMVQDDAELLDDADMQDDAELPDALDEPSDNSEEVAADASASTAADDQSSQATDETADTGEAQTSPHTPPLEDFLAIVPKPTLLSKEKAKKRLQAFNMSKLNEYYISKKKAAVEAAAQTIIDAAKVKQEAADEAAIVERKAAKAAKASNDVDACAHENHAGKQVKSGKTSRPSGGKRRASFTDERIRRRGSRGGRRVGRKRTRSRTPIAVAPGNRKRSRRNSIRSRERNDHCNDKGARDEHHRDKPAKEVPHSKPAHGKDSKNRKRSRSRTKDNANASCGHPEERGPPQELSDIRKMLLFNSICYNFKPFNYKKHDGSLADLSIQFLRYTTISMPRIAYSPNPSRTKGTYYQRGEVFSVVAKSQKDALVNLIAQAAQGKPLAPLKPATTRSWYLKDCLTEQHADKSLFHDDAELEQYAKHAGDDAKPRKRRHSKQKKAKSKQAQREVKRKRHKKDKSKKRRAEEQKAPDGNESAKPVADAPAAAVADSKPRHRTDSHKSDTNSINSTDASHSNHVNHNAVHSPKMAEVPKTPPMRPKREPSMPNHVYRRHSETADRKHDQNELSFKIHEKKCPVKSMNALRDDYREEMSVLTCKSVLAELSKTPLLAELSKTPLPLPSLLSTPTKVYNIRTDCIDKLDLVPVVHKLCTVVCEPKEKHPEVVITTTRFEIDDVLDNKQVDVKACLLGRHGKDATAPIEKLKSKPSELYSPTCQSLSSASSTSDADMPDADEIWASDDLAEDNSPKLLDSSWESEDECYVVVAREPAKVKGLEQRSLEMPLNINIGRPRSQVIMPKAMPDIKAPSLFDDLETGTGWDGELRHNIFEIDPNSQSPSSRANLELEYMQFISSVSTIEEKTHGKRRYSTSSSSSSGSSSSSSSATSAEGELATQTREPCTSSEVVPAATAVPVATAAPVATTVLAASTPQNVPAVQSSPVCNVDSTSSPAVAGDDKEAKLQLSVRRPLPAIVLAKKSPLVGCSLFRDEDSDNETSQTSNQANSKSGEKHAESDVHSHQPSPPTKRSESPQAAKISKPASPTRRDNSTLRHYSRNRRRSPARREDSPKRTDNGLRRDARRGNSPRRAGSPRRMSPRRSPKRGMSPRRGAGSRNTSPRRFPSPRNGSPKRMSPRRPTMNATSLSRDSSPRYREPEKMYPQDCRRREGSPRHRAVVRRRSRSPKHDHRSPPRQREYNDGLRNRDERYRDHRYRDGSPPRYRELSPGRFSPNRRRLSPPRHRFSPKRDGSPRYRLRSPRRRSMSPNRRIYSRSNSKERKHETITQALHRLAGMEYEPPKSPRPVDSPMDGYIRGVADSTISDDQLLQNRGGDFNATQSPVFQSFNPPFKHADGTGSPKRIPLDDRINQVLGIDAKETTDYSSDPYYNQQMYYDQFAGNMQTNHYDHYNQHVNNVPTKVLQVGNVLQVVPTEQQPQPVKEKADPIPEPCQLPEVPKKFVPVGNMLEIVPTTELGPPPKLEEPVAPPVQPEVNASTLAEDLLKLRMAERKAEREKRRQERDRRRKDKELKRKEREQRKQIKLKLKSEAMIKKALMYDAIEDAQPEELPKATSVTVTSSGVKVLKGILTRKSHATADKETHSAKKKGVKFADGVLPGEGTSPSGGEELSSPPPFSKVPKEKRYTKTKRPKVANKKKIKVKIVRTKTKKVCNAADDNAPPPSPPPGSPPINLFPPRVKPNLINPTFYANYSFNALAFPPDTTAHPPFTIPNMQYPPMPHLHLPPGQPPPMTALPPLHPISLLLPPPPAPSRLVAKPLGKPIDKGM